MHPKLVQPEIFVSALFLATPCFVITIYSWLIREICLDFSAIPICTYLHKIIIHYVEKRHEVIVFGYRMYKH